ADRHQVRSHLAGEHLDCTRAVHPERVALVGELSAHRVGYRVERLREHKDVGNETARSAYRRLIVTVRARSRVGARSANESWIVRRIAFSRYTGAGRSRTALSVNLGPPSREDFLSKIEQLLEL